MHAVDPGSTAAAVPSDSATASAAPTKKPYYECQQCNDSFKRVDHLKRHMKLHTGEMEYQCRCGGKFSRNDAPARHLRRCENILNDQRLLPKGTRKQTRSKSACDPCAKLKVRCDSQAPCRHCKRKSLACKYSRQGYSDPYNSFRAGRESDLSTSPENDPDRPDGQHSLSNSDGSEARIPSAIQPNLSSWQFTLLDDTLQQIGAQQSNNNATSDQDPANIHDMVNVSTELHFPTLFDSPFELESLLDPATIGYDSPNYSAMNQRLFSSSENSDIIKHHRPSNLRQIGSFGIQQIDPVEAKCLEIRNLLQGSEPFPTKTNDIVKNYITRRNLVLCTELYGRHFQPNVPIIHLPTFSLIEASPTLLLAVVLVGACYSDNLIPFPHIYTLAMQLLELIENQLHEKNMQAPPLSTIQASIILHPVLICSRNETASKFVSLYFARNISMAERAGVFDSTDPIDYDTLNGSTFVWSSWIEQETRKRIACQIFCQDMAICVFRRRSPSFSPLNFNTDLPCYESCWKAETASQCLRELQTLPRQIRVSTVTQYLLSDSAEGFPMFEASTFGMLILILGLHCLLFQATQNDLEPSANLATTTLFPPNAADPISLFHRDFSSMSITTLADELIAGKGSSTIKRINSMLNAWRANWDLRRCRELSDEHRRLSGDPLRFWWLAKLYLVFYFHRHQIRKDSEFGILEAGCGDESIQVQVQLKIINWLLRFRSQVDDVRLSTECYLPQIMQPSQGGYKSILGQI